MTGTSDSLFDQFYKVFTVNQGHNVFISLGKYIIYDWTRKDIEL